MIQHQLKESQTESQTLQILNYLLLGCRITPLEALRFFNCFRLSGRVYEIENLYGVTVDRELIPVGKKWVAQYFIHNKPKRK